MPRSLFGAAVLAAALRPVLSQQIYDVWQTTWDRTNLFSNISPSTPINFVTPGPAASADIVINDGQQFQPVYGFGGSLSRPTFLNCSEATMLTILASQRTPRHCFSTI